MGSESPNPPTGHFLTSLTENIAQLIRWIAELIRQRNWFTLLVLVGVGLALLAHFGRDQLNQIIKEEFQAALSILLWGAVGLIFVLALGIAVRTLPRAHPPKLKDLAERKAIKGLRPFGPDDAEIFAQLQRERLLRDCVEVMTGSNFRFGILMGESGCGKTSFLQAGVLPQFLRPDCECCGVYVRFSDQEPLVAIRQALSKQLEIPMEWLTAETDMHPFLELLTQAVTAADKPMVLFLDQFEQWYVHAKRPDDRQPFLQGLMAWYRQPMPDVKILVSIRSDLYFHIVEIHKALDFNLGPQDVFQLTKFTPGEATQVLAVIAQTEKLSFEPSFVMELAEQELADREDGRISPVDVQILAWMIERQNASELRAFNRQAFQKFGGVEGLLMRFLDQALMARVSEAQRQAAIKVLLALTDLERQVRAGALTVMELQQKLTGSLSAQEVREAVGWLERGDVRLITPVNQPEEDVGYELAHERLIPSLLKQAGRELTAADQANQLLNRRVNEWLGNNRSKRYLFGPWELWSIKQQKPYLTWGPKRPQKEKLLALSWRRVQGFTGALMAVCLVISVFLGWLWYVPEGQIQQVRWALINPLGSPLARVSDEDAVNAAIAFAKYGKKKQAIDIAEKYIDRPSNQVIFLSKLALLSVDETDANNLKADLRRAENKLKEIDDPSDISSALITISSAYIELMKPDLAKVELDSTLVIAGKINDPGYKSRALSAISSAYSALVETDLVIAGLEEILILADEINDLHYKSNVLESVAAAFGKLQDVKLAKAGLDYILVIADEINESSSKAEILEALATAYGELQDIKLAKAGLDNVLMLANQINDPSYKATALRASSNTYSFLGEYELALKVLDGSRIDTKKIDGLSSYDLKEIAVSYKKLKQPHLALKILDEALAKAQKSNDIRTQSNKLSEIAIVYDKLNEPQVALKILNSALEIADQLDHPFHKSLALESVAKAFGELEDPELSSNGLNNVLVAADKLSEIQVKPDVLSVLAYAYTEIKDTKLVKEGLDNVLNAAEAANASDTLKTISVQYAYINHFGLALRALRYCPEAQKAKALTHILTLWAEQENPKLIDGAVITEQPKIISNQSPYSFTINLYSPTKNCQKYIDWWEILSEDQELLDRRTFSTNRSKEKSFTDTSNPIQVSSNQSLILRAHLYSSKQPNFIKKTGYEARQAWEGTIHDGFRMVRLPANFATDLVKADPQPQPCQ